MPDSTTHESYVIERQYQAPPGRVFAAFADPAIKRRWFIHEAQAVGEYEVDFRVGGREVSRFLASGPGFGPAEIRNDTFYLDIVPDRRIVFAYSMANEGVPFSASLATVTLTEVDGSTKMTYTEQAVFFEGGDGAAMRKDGWTVLFERLAETLGEASSPASWQG